MRQRAAWLVARFRRASTILDFLPIYRELARRGELTAHVAAYPVVKPDLGSSQIDVVEALRARYKDVPNLTIPGLKVFADGVVETPSQTAALTKPLLNTGRSTPLLFSPAKMNALVTEADKRGLMVHVHAIGDLAVKEGPRSMRLKQHARLIRTARCRFTLTHAQFVDPEDIPRFSRLRVIAALQLLWAVADPSTNEEVKPFIDLEIYRWMYPARSLLDTRPPRSPERATGRSAARIRFLRSIRPKPARARRAFWTRRNACPGRPCCMRTRAGSAHVLNPTARDWHDCAWQTRPISHSSIATSSPSRHRSSKRLP